VIGLVLAAAAVLQGAPQGGWWGWSCGTSLSVDGFEGGVYRDFGPGFEHAPYRIELREPGQGRGHNVSWTIDPRPEGPPPSARPSFLDPRREQEAFASGPNYVHIDFDWLAEATGPIHAYYWGDGAYAGADLLMSARQVRRFTDRDGRLGGLSGGLAVRTLLSALAPARRWTVAAVDSTGKTLFSESFDLPRREAVEAAFRRARAAIDSVEARFRPAHRPINEGGVRCEDKENPESAIL
jgi:hypothetical protein